MPSTAAAHASAATDAPALLSIDGAIATITLNRPSAFNAIDIAIAKQLEQIGLELEADDTVRVVVIEGAGRAFCGGGDIQTFVAHIDNIAPVVEEMLKHYHTFIATLRRMGKVVIASVHGSAAGAGLSLVLVSDICIAADDAKFTPAYHKLGVSPDGGGTVGAAAIMGARRALQMFLAEDTFGAAQALEWGIAAKLVPAAELKQATRALAQKIAANPPAAIALTKTLVYRAATTPVEQQLDAEKNGIHTCMRSQDFRDAVNRFVNRKK